MELESVLEEIKQGMVENYNKKYEEIEMKSMEMNEKE